MAVFNACEGGRSGRNDPFAGIAQTLVLQRIPAVVAMQFEISDLAAIRFSQVLYETLARGDPIDKAITHARRAIYAFPNAIEWATPVLYLRTPDGRIFDVKPGTHAEEIVRASDPTVTTTLPGNEGRPKQETTRLDRSPSLHNEGEIQRPTLNQLGVEQGGRAASNQELDRSRAAWWAEVTFAKAPGGGEHEDGT